MRLASRGVFLLLLGAAWAGVVWAAPPPPPGGHHPIHRGGDNRPGYPPLQQRVSVARPTSPAGALNVACAPNPFRATTQFSFVLRPGEAGRLRMFTLQGRQVRTFAVASGAGGAQRLVWDGRDHRGRRVPPGAYLFRLEAGRRSAKGKVVYIR